MRSLSHKNEKKLIIILFLIVPILFLVAFSYYPAVKLFELSFSDWNGYSPSYSYTGLQNYLSIFKDQTALKTLQNNLAYFVIALAQMILGLYFAIILDSGIKAKNFFKSLIFMPFILNGVAIAYMFSYMYDYQRGPINLLLSGIGLGEYAVHWLGDSYFINFSLAFIGMWRYTGFTMVVFLGALQSIPKSFYEASSIDGANFFENIRYITLPNISRVIELNLFLSINGALQAFFEAFVITKGGPGIRSHTFATMIYSIAFEYQNFGKASAMSVFLLILILSVVMVQKVLMKERGEVD